MVYKDNQCFDCGPDQFSDTSNCVQACASGLYDAQKMCAENVEEFPDDSEDLCQFMLKGSVWAYFNDFHC